MRQKSMQNYPACKELTKSILHLKHLVGQVVSASDFGSRVHGFESHRRWTSAHDCMALHCTKPFIITHTSSLYGGWSGGVKVLCILHHWGIQLILAYSWARPAILVVGKGRGGMFLFLLFLHFHSCSSFFPVPLFHLLYSLFYLFSPFLWEMTQNDPQGLTCR